MGQAAPGAGKEATSQKDVLWIIPHTHWEGAVFKTREEYLKMGLVNISAALHLLAEHPEYRFVLDQAAYVRPYLERYPEDAATFRKFVKEGRLQLVGGTDVMPDVNMPSGESFVRQILYGKGYYRDELGVDVTVGWNLDTFGHNAQMPQILKLAGYESYWFSRGVSSMDTPSEFKWQGIDGTQIPAFWLPQGYGIFYDSPANPAEFERFARERFAALTPFSRGNDRVALAGADVSEPEGQLPGMVKQFNQSGDEPFSLRFGVPTDFEAVVAKRPDRQVLGGELNPIFQGIYSSRIELKQWMRKMEGLLSSAERLGALARWLGAPLDPDELTRAWEPVLFNQTHDLASGVMVDKVYDDVLRGYNFSKRSADEMMQTFTKQIASKIETRGEGFPVVVFNTLGWPRTDVVETDVDLTEGGFNDLSLLDSVGKPVPVQITEASHHGDGGIRHAQFAFVAQDVPALGFAVYHVVPKTASRTPEGETPTPRLGGTAPAKQEYQGSIENEFYRATFNLWTGEMTNLVDKLSGWEVLRGSGNVVAEEQDGGDIWQLYGTLTDGQYCDDSENPDARPDAFEVQQRVGGKRGHYRRPGLFRVPRYASLRQRELLYARAALRGLAASRHRDTNLEQRFVRAVPSVIPDHHQRWKAHGRNPLWGHRAISGARISCAELDRLWRRRARSRAFELCDARQQHCRWDSNAFAFAVGGNHGLRVRRRL